MSLPTSIHPFLITGNDANQYKIANSLRFRSGNSAYLSRTPGSASNRTTWTWSAWIKRGSLGSQRSLFTSYYASSAYDRFEFTSSDTLRYQHVSSSITYIDVATSAVFRDPSAWYHVVLRMDGSQSSGSRWKLYVNSIQQTFSGTDNTNASLINNNNATYIGYDQQSGTYFDGYMAEVNFIDGQALTPSSFGQTDNLTNQWVPKRYTGTYGTNGFYLPFKDNSSTTALGYDVTNGTGALTTPYAASITTNNSGWDTLGVRMLLTTGAIQQQGKSFRITLKSGSNGLNIQGVKFGVKASSGNAWDFAGDQVSVTFGGSTTYSLGSNSTLTSDWMVYPSIINPSSDYILALAIGTTNGTTLSGSATTGSIRNYTKAGDYNSGALTTAPTGYSDAGTAAYFLTALEVQGNNWTPSGISVTSGTTYDSMIDSPTTYDDGSNIYNRGNYCTLNPLTNSTVTISEGNLKVGYTTYTNWVKATFGITSGKWYWETSQTTSGVTSFVVGLSLGSASTSSEPIQTSSWWYAGYDGGKYNGNSTDLAYGATYGASDIIGVAFDADNGTVTYYKNNVSQGQAFTGLTNGPYFPSFGFESSATTWTISVNFGQRPFSYTPPAGFKALNSYNLANPSLPLV